MFGPTYSTRRQVLRFGAVAAVGGLLVACSSSPAAPPTQPASSAAPASSQPTTAPAKPASSVQPTTAPAAKAAVAGQSVKLVFWRYTSTLQDSVIADFIKRYGEAHPGVAIDQANFPGLDTYRQKVLAAVAAKSGPDFLYSDGPWLPEFASRSILDPAPPEVVNDLKAHWTKGGANYVTYKGVTYGYPWETSIHQLYINDDLFKTAGLDPTKPPNNSFTDFRAAVKKLAKQTSGTVSTAGWIANPRLFYFGNWLYNNGAVEIGEDENGDVSEPAHATLGDPKALEVWQLWYDIYNTDKSSSGKLPAGTDSFVQGNNAMVVSGNFFIDSLRTNAPKLNYSISHLVTNLGTPVGQLGGWTSVVMRGSSTDKKAVAWDYLRWINTKDNQLQSLAKFNWLSTRTDVISDPKAVVLAPDKLPKFYEVMPNISHVRPRTVVYQQLESSLQPIFQQMLLGQTGVQQSVDAAVKAANSLLSQASQ